MGTKLKKIFYSSVTKVISTILFMVCVAALFSVCFDMIRFDVSINEHSFYDTYEFSENYGRLSHNVLEKQFKLHDIESIIASTDDEATKSYNISRLRTINENLDNATSFMYALENQVTGEVISNVDGNDPVGMIKEQPSSIVYEYGGRYFPEGSILNEINDYAYMYNQLDYILELLNTEESTWSYYTAVNKVINENDTFFYPGKVIYDYGNAHRNTYIVVIVISIFIMLAIGVYWLFSIGRNSVDDKPGLTKYDDLVQEIQTIITISVLSMIPLYGSVITNNFYDIQQISLSAFIILLCLVELFALVLVLQCMSLLRLLKCRMFIKKTLLYQVVKGILNLFTIPILDQKYKFRVFILLIGLVFICGLGFVMVIVIPPIGILFCIIVFCLLLYRVYYILDEIRQVLENVHNRAIGNESEHIHLKYTSKFLKGLVADIEDLQHGFDKAVEEKVKGEKLKTELITNVTHDLKNPLTSIISYIEVLQSKHTHDPESEKYINILGEKANRLKILIEQLVEAAKVNSGNVTVQLEEVDVNQLTRQLCGEFYEKLEERQLKCITSEKKDPVYVMADRNIIYRILENLMSNVSKYAMEGTRVYIDIVEQSNLVSFIIKNISSEALNFDIEDLSKRFVRGDKSRNTEGSGLGLSIALDLARAMGSELVLDIDGDLFKASLNLSRAEMEIVL